MYNLPLETQNYSDIATIITITNFIVTLSLLYTARKCHKAKNPTSELSFTFFVMSHEKCSGHQDVNIIFLLKNVVATKRCDWCNFTKLDEAETTLLHMGKMMQLNCPYIKGLVIS